MNNHCFYLYLFVSSLNLFFHKSGQAQNSALVHYEYISYVGHKTSATLTIKEGNCWYSRHQEPATVVTEERYEFYYYTSYKDWYYDNSDKTIIQIWRNKKNPPFYGQWTADIKWQITEETKEIAGYKVQKATTAPLMDHSHSNITFHTAIAWFTIDIPFSFGPEGYYGLPGLIVKLEHEGFNSHTNKTLIYESYSATLEKVEYIAVKNWDVPNSSGKIKIQKEQFDYTEIIDKKWLKQQKKLLKKKSK